MRAIASLLLLCSVAFGEDCISIDQAPANVGKNVCVTGTLLKVSESRGGVLYLDFCANYRECTFTAVVLKGDRHKVGDLSDKEGKEVTIYGELKTYNGRPEIVIADKRQFDGFVKTKPAKTGINDASSHTSGIPMRSTPHPSRGFGRERR